MKPRSNFAQRGVSITGLIFVLGILGVVGVLAMKIVPTVTEFMAVKKAVTYAQSAGSTPAEIRASFDKQADVGYIESITGKELEIVNQNGKFDVSFAYEKRIPLVGPASLVLDYQGSTVPPSLGKKKPKTVADGS